MLRLAFPQLPAWPPAWATIAGIMVALTTGVLASILPASKAAKLDAVNALGKK